MGMDKHGYKEWFTFNNMQRVHLNYFEFMGVTLVVMVIAGMFQPLWAASIGVAGILGGELYGLAYGKMNNPNMRIFGALIHELGVMVNIGIAFYNLAPLCLKQLTA